MTAHRVQWLGFTSPSPANTGLHYTPPPPRHRSETRQTAADDQKNWKSRTPAIVGLFLTRNAAIACLHSPNPKPNDPRWRTQSEATLTAITDHHPVFVISSLHYQPEPAMAAATS